MLDFINTPQKKACQGRPPRIGARIVKDDIANQDYKISWYGSKVKNVSARFTECLWLAGKTSELLQGVAGWVRWRSDDEFIVMGFGSNLAPKDIMELYIKRWNLEVTFRESREYLGVETQRQWSDLSIERTTPVLFAIYSLVVLMGDVLWKQKNITPLCTAWYQKEHLTFSDLFYSVKKELWRNFSNYHKEQEFDKNLSTATLPSKLRDVMGF